MSRSGSPARRCSRSRGSTGGDAYEVTVRAGDKAFSAVLRLDTPREREYVKHGGILPFVVRKLASAA